MSTGAWHGSPFEYVVTNTEPLHKSLQSLGPEDHQTYRELADAGGRDFYATVLEYRDGSRQACSYVTDRDAGFGPADLRIIEQTRAELGSVLEPLAVRRSAESLLTTYLGIGPAGAVIEGSIQRGEYVQIEAAIMFADMRGFTEKSVTWPEVDFLSAQDDFFEAVVEAVHAHCGDVLATFQEARGQGAATHLLNCVRRKALEAGFRRLSLITGDANPARRLYERFGFTVAGSAKIVADRRWSIEGNKWLLYIKEID